MDNLQLKKDFEDYIRKVTPNFKEEIFNKDANDEYIDPVIQSFFMTFEVGHLSGMLHQLKKLNKKLG